MLNRPYISLVPIVCLDNHIMEYAQDEDIFFHLENMLLKQPMSMYKIYKNAAQDCFWSASYFVYFTRTLYTERWSRRRLLEILLRRLIIDGFYAGWIFICKAEEWAVMAMGVKMIKKNLLDTLLTSSFSCWNPGFHWFCHVTNSVSDLSFFNHDR